MLGLDPAQLAGDQIEGAVPIEGNEGLSPAPVPPAAGPVFQPAGANVRAVDANFAVDRVGNRAQQVRGRLVLLERQRLGNAAVLDHCFESAP